MRLINVATCNLNQWALDFTGNLERIKTSIEMAREKRCKVRTGPELEISGYSCEDHFLEEDTMEHSWECLIDLVETGYTDDIIIDVGMPVMHQNVRYNCRVFVCNRKIVLIRPKMCLANDGNYRETRWFSAWSQGYTLQDHYLPRIATAACDQRTAPFGIAIIQVGDVALASETCEELFTPDSPHITLGLDGVEIFLNGSGSHHQLRKLNQRVELIKSATSKGGGVYLYANQKGCDGNRLYFDGSAMIMQNGQMLEQASQFSIREVEVISATVDVNDVRNFRGAIASRSIQAAGRVTVVPKIFVDNIDIIASKDEVPSLPKTEEFLSAEEEIASGPPCWLWDYLRRSGLTGFMLPLSGGADSSATATLVGLMCELVVAEINQTEYPASAKQTLADVHKITKDTNFIPKTSQELCNRVLYTCYMGTEYSGEETRSRAERLAEVLGANHRCVKIDEMTEAVTNVFMQQSKLNCRPDIKNKGTMENIAQQNIQARSRMVLAYYMAQLLPWDNGHAGSLLVLGSANVDEALRGYYTKYDCSAADINPIGGISKVDLTNFLLWCAKTKGWSVHQEVVDATPTAELQPLSPCGKVTQSDEDEMGMSYQELSVFGTMRSAQRCGPVSMFRKLCQPNQWGSLFSPSEIAAKVKRFFFFYSVNRHKMTTLTPSYHAESYSPDDNRFDLRQFLYRASWPFQFSRIENLVKGMTQTSSDDSKL